MLRAASWGLNEIAMGMFPKSPAVAAGDCPPTRAPSERGNCEGHEVIVRRNDLTRKSIRV